MEFVGSTYDIRDLLNATSTLSDGKKLTDISLEPNVKAVLAEALKKIAGTDIEKLLKEYQLI